MPKYLFLDIDGVLNANNMRSVYEESIALLNQIHERVPSLLVVVSSTWRIYDPVDRIQKVFEAKGYEHELHDATGTERNPPPGFEDRPESHWMRGGQILRYLEDHGIGDRDIAILDDDSDMHPFMHRLVNVTNPGRTFGTTRLYVPECSPKGCIRQWHVDNVVALLTDG